MPKIDEIVAEEEARADIPFEEMFAGPAFFSNKVYVTLVPLGVRLTFMEVTPDGSERFRTAAHLNILDAIGLRDVLKGQIEKLHFSLEEVARAAEEPPTETNEQ